jgi:hypothetical protein
MTQHQLLDKIGDLDEKSIQMLGFSPGEIFLSVKCPGFSFCLFDGLADKCPKL